MIPVPGRFSGRSSLRMTSGAAVIVRPRWSGVTIRLSQGCLASRSAKSCRKASMAVHAPARWLVGCDALIVADLSNDASYAEVLYETFGPRVIGLQISRYGDGMSFERRPVKYNAMLVYTIGRTYLLDLFHAQLQSDQVRIVDGPNSRGAYEQLAALETEMRDSGIVYSCPPGQHDDLGISCAMLAWAAQHPHGEFWVRTAHAARKVRKPRQAPSSLAWT
jgi:hypothetical protein